MKYLAVICVVAGSLVPHAEAGTILLEPSAVTVDPGQSFSLNVNGIGLTDLYAFQLDIVFTPGLLSVTDTTEGPFLSSGETTVFVPGAIDNVTGTISFLANTLVSSAPGVNGSGTLATLHLLALSPGTTTMTLSNVVLLDSTLAEISVSTINGSVTVSGVPEPTTAVLLVVGLTGMLASAKRSGRMQ